MEEDHAESGLPVDARSGRQYESVVVNESAAFVLVLDRHCHVVGIIFGAGSCHSAGDASVGVQLARCCCRSTYLTSSSFIIQLLIII